MVVKIPTKYEIVLNAFGDSMSPVSTGEILVDPTEPHAALEELFARYNRGSGREFWFTHRSLSVGDLIRLGEVTYRCDSCGWSIPEEVR